MMMMMASRKGVSSSFPGAVSVPAYERLQATSMFLILDRDNLGRIVKSKGSSCKGDNSEGKERPLLAISRKLEMLVHALRVVIFLALHK